MKKTILISVALSTLLLHATEKDNLEKRVESLEKALKATKEQQLQEKMKKALNSSNSFKQQDFIPDIALILSASAVSRNIKNSEYEGYGIDGFVDETDEIPFNKNRGFNLNYAEFSMHSAVGPYFDADAIFHLHPDEFEIEEAYITTKKLPANLQIKAGAFRSGFGRINAIHAHAQHFMAQPLVYEALLGVEGIKDPGIALKWVAPTDTYISLGAEALQGSNELSFGEPEKNNLYVGYLKTGFDLGENTTVLTGASIAKGKTQQNQDSKLYGGEFTLKHTLDSYSSINWQSEYLYRDKNSKKQAGFYSQLVYDINSNWEVGTRYDALTKNVTNQPDDLKKYSAIVQYKPFEFSKLRLQYSHDKSKSFGDKRKTEDFIGLEFLIEAGAHGAHAF
ncbi:Zinc-regulated TonB-dependent outer membrane receptor [hydrothermal vent metagenome]|uniref:Zinc-regulated TonB-dependent outer membrane receptor n=1 Tax=hydrothermal vent metagenome TaxID=652676 RepID=A0A1W1BR86_9ZZZZ